jgi:hypothetical protein
VVDVGAEAFGDDALGLFDEDPAVERGLQLLGEDVPAADRAMLQQANGRDVNRVASRTPPTHGDCVRTGGLPAATPQGCCLVRSVAQLRDGLRASSISPTQRGRAGVAA